MGQPASTANDSSRGYAAAIAAFAIWGLFPLYLIGLRNVSALQITAHRIVWSCVFAVGWLAAIGDLGKLRDAFQRNDVLSTIPFTVRVTRFGES